MNNIILDIVHETLAPWSTPCQSALPMCCMLFNVKILCVCVCVCVCVCRFMCMRHVLPRQQGPAYALHAAEM